MDKKQLIEEIINDLDALIKHYEHKAVYHSRKKEYAAMSACLEQSNGILIAKIAIKNNY